VQDTSQINWALVVPMANEENEFVPFIHALKTALDKIMSGCVYLVVDNASVDKTLELCKNISSADNRFKTVWAPENKNVVDAYIRGYREALKNNHSFIIEMDAGLSHDPAVLPVFLKYLSEGNECVYGSRFISGGTMSDSPANRTGLSKIGTILSNLLLGTKLHDMTSGYQGFTKEVAAKFAYYSLKSKAHFFQTEIRYLLRKNKFIETPIHYKAPSPRVSRGAVKNAIYCLLYYFWRRITFRSVSL
jgi:dolichol-phosphate mannosyltransferase